MLTIEQLQIALNDPTLTKAELEEMRQACNTIAEIFLEHRCGRPQPTRDALTDPLSASCESDAM
jgi:hypothetical protein